MKTYDSWFNLKGKTIQEKVVDFDNQVKSLGISIPSTKKGDNNA
jgi:hypothetical protein